MSYSLHSFVFAFMFIWDALLVIFGHFVLFILGMIVAMDDHLVLTITQDGARKARFILAGIALLLLVPSFIAGFFNNLGK